LQDSTQDDLVTALSKLTIAANDLPVRPDFGTLGKQIKVRTNFFPVKVPKGPLYEYDIAITPKAKELAKRIKKRIFELVERSPEWKKEGLKGRVAHDSSAKLISAHRLPNPLSITITYYDEDEEVPKPGTGKKFTLDFTYTQTIDTSDLTSYLRGEPQYRDYDIMPVISALNIILASHPNRLGSPGVMVGRNRWFFQTPESPAVSLGGGVEAFRGFYSSVRPAHNTLLVNVNVCTTAFYTPGNLAEAIDTFCSSTFGARPNAFVKGVRVKTTHLGYKKTVKGVSNFTAETYKFRVDEYKAELTVKEYFLRKYNIRLRKPDMPLVDLGGAKTNLFPPELCEILPNQAFRGKLSDEQTAQMIKVAAKPPNVNANAITGQGLRELGFSAPANANPFGPFDVQVQPEMAVVPARILPYPGIQYGRSMAEVDQRASWNLRNIKFQKGATLSNWAVLVIGDGGRDEFQGNNDPELHRTIAGFMSMCNTSGMRIQNKPTVVGAKLPPKHRDDGIRSQAIAIIKSALLSMKSKPEFILVILSSGDKHIYNGLKKLCDTEMDVATSCVHSAKIRKEKGQMQYFANVALKVNMKLGGVNHILDKNSMTWFKQRPTMLVGMDVTHPGPGSVSGTPSIAAVVANCDADFAQYPCSMRVQESKKEMITDIEQMLIERLLLFNKRNKGILPERILVYRDGVSEGQFKAVIEEELPGMKAAFRKFDTAQKPYLPRLTIVICGKRHHTRFYPTNEAEADDKGNPRPGTVVDRGVTSVYNFDFFLQAHGGLQGTTRPTHYYVVHDELGFKADTLQTLTNSVSFMFARATKAVSLASPAYYADLACERGRCYIARLLQGMRAGVTNTRQTGGTADREEADREGRQLWNQGVAGANLKDTMFYL